MRSIAHRRIPTNGIELHVVEAGREDGPLALLLHGFPENWLAWEAQIASLLARGYRIWLPDQRGYGESDKPLSIDAYVVEQLCADVLGLIDASGASTVTLMGHDWGGLVAWALASAHPTRFDRVVIANAPHPEAMRELLRRQPAQLLRSYYIAVFQLPALPEAMLRARNFLALRKALELTSRAGTFDRLMDDYVGAWRQPGALRGMLNWYRALRRQRRSAAVGPVRVPLLLLWGAQDFALKRELAERSVAYCERGTLRYIEEAGHWVLHEAADGANRLIGEFLDGS